jgi:hypothetical protein
MRWLLDVVAITAWVWWQRPREPRPLPVKPLGVGRFRRGAVVVLASSSRIETRVRLALGERTTLHFVRTWAELYDVVARSAPLTVFVDPFADGSEDPREHFARFACEWHFPVVVYTELAPQLAQMLSTMGRAGIRTMLFARLDDDLDRIVDAVPWELYEPPRRVA